MKKFFLAVTIFTLSIGITSSVYSSNSVTAQFNTAKVIVNGNVLSEPNLNYNGSLYVPLRAVSDNIGGKSSWTDETKTAVIYSKDYFPEYQPPARLDTIAKTLPILRNYEFTMEEMKRLCQNLLTYYNYPSRMTKSDYNNIVKQIEDLSSDLTSFENQYSGVSYETDDYLKSIRGFLDELIHIFNSYNEKEITYAEAYNLQHDNWNSTSYLYNAIRNEVTRTIDELEDLTD